MRTLQPATNARRAASCLRRTSPWRVNIQPGYSAGRRLAASRRFSSSAPSATFVAPMLSSSCSAFFAPMITLVTARLVQQPGERDLRHRHAARAGDLAHDVDAVEGALLVDRREVERGAAAARFAVLVAAVLAAQQAAGERAPDHQAEAFALQHRDQLALEVAAGDRVVGLQASKRARPSRSAMPSAFMICQAAQFETPT